MRKQGKDYIVFPLDAPDAEKAMELCGMLKNYVGVFKVGLELFIKSGPDLVKRIISETGAPVFLDLKLHDIPETVRRATACAAETGAVWVTAHCSENPDMLRAAVQGGGGRIRVLAVTLLTSVSAADLQSAGYGNGGNVDVAKLVADRAQTAQRMGCVGAVCSAQEAHAVRTAVGKDFLLVTPGIRPAWGQKSDDQKRIATPAAAIRNGSDYLVIGRPIRDAANPQLAALEIAKEIEEAF